jgi:lipoprotein NlpI
MARLLFSRALELNPKLISAESWIGITWIYMNDLEAAKDAFKSALSKNSHEPNASYGLAALYRQFGFKSKLTPMLSRIKSYKRPSGPIHPWMAGF